MATREPLKVASKALHRNISAVTMFGNYTVTEPSTNMASTGSLINANITWVYQVLEENITQYMSSNYTEASVNKSVGLSETLFPGEIVIPSTMSSNLSVVDRMVTANVSASASASNASSTNYLGMMTEDPRETVYIVLTSTVLGLLILLTIIGNVFVIAAILFEKNLQSIGNYLVLSLAVADLMVAVLVMPMGAVYVVNKQWIMGPELCDIWTASDVLCCTASILHLLAIALDRYWAVTNINYIHSRTSRRIYVMIFFIWFVSLAVSIPPVFGLKDPGFYVRLNIEKKCLLSQDMGYQIFATFSSFFVPLVLILILYWKIFQAARKRIRRKARKKIPPPERTTISTVKINETTVFTTTNHSSNNASPEKSSGGGTNHSNSQQSNMSDMSKVEMIPKKEKRSSKEGIEHKRERKAAKTLAIITGVFIFCWLPFFVSALIGPVCASCMIHELLSDLMLWLGYCNSLLNPIIYTIFSPDFRNAFKKILLRRLDLQRRARR